MNAMRVGIDLVTISHFRDVYSGDGREALSEIFTESELRDVGDGVDEWERLAARFAAKEAAFKALEESSGEVTLRDVVVCSQTSRAPRLELSGGALLRARDLGVSDWLVSLTHTGDIAGAVVIALSK